MKHDRKLRSDPVIDPLHKLSTDCLASKHTCEAAPSNNVDAGSCGYLTIQSMSHDQVGKGAAFGFLINDVSRMFRQSFEAVVEEAGLALTSGETRSLFFVATYRGSRQTSLAARMGIRPMTMSAYIDNLERQGLVVRSPDPADRRANLIFITSKAEAILNALQLASDEFYDKAISSISPAQAQSTEAALRIVSKNLS